MPVKIEVPDEDVSILLAEADKKNIPLGELLQERLGSRAMIVAQSAQGNDSLESGDHPQDNVEPPPRMPNAVRKEWVSYWRNIIGLIRDGGLLAIALIFLAFYLFGRDPQNLTFREWRDLAVAAFAFGAYITGALVFDNGLVGSMHALEDLANRHGKDTLGMSLGRIRSVLAWLIARFGRTVVRGVAFLFLLLLGILFAWGIVDMADRYSETDTISAEEPGS